MTRLTRTLCIGLFTICIHSAVLAEETMTDTFENNPEKRWSFIADTVMGGISTGQVRFAEENGSAYARMTGEVSTQNRGGFIQIRKELSDKSSDGAKGVRLIVRGNGQKYFVHLRTSGTVLPWQYYQGGFSTTDGWTEVRIPFSDFKASGRMVRSEVRASSLKSIGIVAFGRDHQAEIKIREVGFY